ncbi:hypothetical protein EGW08_008977 [Elysia chlorotica]|uniref:Uncharacterized protein n=1 Tax=Elysia chlorotica TaxID=188477 RepID=A0A3S0ZQB1_ELYCH|nr:hypothetical protein EGW08_008977 [Elysia chlorotica]
MGGSSSAPASPESSPNMGIVGRVEDTRRGSPPRPSSSRGSLTSLSRERGGRSMGRPCPGSPKTPESSRRCPSASRAPEDDDECEDDEDDECDDDEDEDECDDDEDEDECDDEEDESDKRACSPCREPAKKSGGSTFAPCRDAPPAQENSRCGGRARAVKEQPGRGRSPCRQASSPCGGSSVNSNRNKSRERSPVSPCRQPEKKKCPSPKTSPKSQCKVEKKKSTECVSPVQSKPHSSGKLPCKESKEKRDAQKASSSPGRSFLSSKHRSVPEKSPKISRWSLAHKTLSQETGAKAKTTLSKDVSSSDSSIKMIGNMASTKDKSPSEKNGSPCEEKQAGSSFYGDIMKELQKGCAYLSRQELRKVCDKYQSYGYVKEAPTESLPKREEPKPIGSDLYAVGFSESRSPESRGEYTGNKSRCSPGMVCDLNNKAVSLDRKSIFYKDTRFRDTEQKDVLKSVSDCESLYTEHVFDGLSLRDGGNSSRSPVKKDSPKKASSAGKKNRWQSRVTNPPLYNIITKRPSMEKTRKESKVEELDDRLESQWQPYSSKGFSQHIRSSEEGIPKTKNIARGNKTNSNNTCLDEQANATCAGYEGEAGEPSTDDLWFDCWEADVASGPQTSRFGASKDCSYFVDGFAECNPVADDWTFSRESGTVYIRPKDNALPNDRQSLENHSLSGLESPFRRTSGRDKLNLVLSGIKSPSKSDLVQSYNIASGVRGIETSHNRAVTRRVFNCKGAEINESTESRYPKYSKSDTDLECRVTSGKNLRFCSADNSSMCFRIDLFISEENVNSNADALTTYKKKKSKKSSQQSSESDGRTLSRSSSLQRHAASDVAGSLLSARDSLQRLGSTSTKRESTILDFNYAQQLGLTDQEIEDLMDSLLKPYDQKIASLKNSEKSVLNVDLARDMGLTREQVKELTDSLTYVPIEEPFDVEAAKRMNLSDKEIESLIQSTSQLNHAKYMLMMGKAPFEESLAHSMGLSEQQVKKLREFSVQTSKITIADLESQGGTPDDCVVIDEALAQSFGLAENQIQKLASSSEPADSSSFGLFNIQLAKYMGLNDEQISRLSESSLRLSQAKREERLRNLSSDAFFDETLAKQMKLSEDQVRKLSESSQQRMLSKSMFDPHLALQYGLSTQQIQELADPDVPKVRTVLNKDVAKSFGLSDSYIKMLEDSLSVSNFVNFDHHNYTAEQAFDIDAARALGLHIREISQLVSTATTPVTPASPAPYLPPVPKASRVPRPRKRGRSPRHGPGRVMSEPAKPKSQMGDGAVNKDYGLWKRIRPKLRSSVNSGERVNGVLTTLVEWNGILLVVIFVLLVSTSCPKATQKYLPCPKLCKALHRNVIWPLGIRERIEGYALDWDGTSDYEGNPRPRGLLYIFLYRIVRDALSFLLFDIVLPILNLPFTVGVPLLETLYVSLSCTVTKVMYFFFYASGAFLGIPIPTRPGVFSQENVEKAPVVPAEPQIKPVEGVDGSKAVQSLGDQPVVSRAEETQSDPPKPFSPTEGEPSPADLQSLHPYGGFLFYVGFDPPKKGCKYSAIPSFFLWLMWSLPEECA